MHEVMIFMIEVMIFMHETMISTYRVLPNAWCKLRWCVVKLRLKVRKTLNFCSFYLPIRILSVSTYTQCIYCALLVNFKVINKTEWKYITLIYRRSATVVKIELASLIRQLKYLNNLCRK